MTEPDEDFASLFEASLKPKRLERGQTIEGRIVAIGDVFDALIKTTPIAAEVFHDPDHTR